MSGEFVFEDVAESLRAAQHQESALVAELKSASPEAFNTLVSHYEHTIYNLVYRLLGDPSDAADTTQEIFLKIFRGIQNFRGDCSLKTWIYRIAVREATNTHRWWFRRQRHRTISLEGSLFHSEENDPPVIEELPANSPSPLEAAMSKEKESRIQRALRTLPVKYRVAVVLRDIEELPYEEIAQALHISIGTVKSRIQRGRELLRSKLRTLLAAPHPVPLSGISK